MFYFNDWFFILFLNKFYWNPNFHSNFLLQNKHLIIIIIIDLSFFTYINYYNSFSHCFFIIFYYYCKLNYFPSIINQKWVFFSQCCIFKLPIADYIIIHYFLLFHSISLKKIIIIKYYYEHATLKKRINLSFYFYQKNINYYLCYFYYFNFISKKKMERCVDVNCIYYAY